MKDFIKSWFSNNGVISSSRINATIIVVAAVVYVGYDTIVHKKLDTGNLSALLAAGTSGYGIGVIRDTISGGSNVPNNGSN